MTAIVDILSHCCAAASHLLPLRACPRNVLISEHLNGHNLTSTKHFSKIQKAFFIACQDLTKILMTLVSAC